MEVCPMNIRSIIKNPTYFILALILSFVFLSTAASAENLSKSVEWFEKGYKFWISGNNTDAVKAFSNAIELNPQFVEAYVPRGLAYGALGNTQQEIKDYNTAIELNPQYAEAYYSRGAVYLIQGNEKLGCSDAQKACALGHCKLLEMAKSKGVLPMK